MCAQKTSSILRDEILSQPTVLSNILKKETKRVERLASIINKYDPQIILIVARGSADNAGLYGKYLFGAYNQKIVALATPSLFTQYKRPPIVNKALVIAISQSGESYDVVEVVEHMRQKGALTIAITNTPKSPLAKAANEILFCHAGKEKSVAATKTYTAQVMLLAMLSSAMQGQRQRTKALLQIPDKVAKALAVEHAAKEVAKRMRYVNQCAVVGRGFCYGTAFEAALKLTELTYVVSQPYSSADFRHGPIAVVDPGFCVLLFAPKGKVLQDAKNLLIQLKDRQAEVIAISDVPFILKQATRGLPIPKQVPEWLSPLTAIIPAQLLAMHLCIEKGYSIDRPRGLSKVTRTR